MNARLSSHVELDDSQQDRGDVLYLDAVPGRLCAKSSACPERCPKWCPKFRARETQRD